MGAGAEDNLTKMADVDKASTPMNKAKYKEAELGLCNRISSDSYDDVRTTV
jgi:hypothetical protein